MTGSLAGQVALVTGGASGIGAAVVKRFAAEGAQVCVFDRVKTPELESSSVLHVEGNTFSYRDNQRAVESTIEAFGQLDIFVGNAGIFDGCTNLLDMSPTVLDAAFEEVFSTNVKGYIFGVHASARELSRRSGCVVLTISSAAYYAGMGGAIYTASKHAAVGLVSQLALELAPRVRVNGVAPGGTMTSLRGPVALGQHKEAYFDTRPSWRMRLAETRLLGFAATPDDHAGAYVFLASKHNSRAMTGEVIRTDGGLGARGH